MKGKNTVEFKNVAVGEVWVCSGQSNMQWEFWRNNLGEQSKTVPAAAKNPNIRLMTLKRVTATTPQYDFPVVTEPREGTKGEGPMVHYGKWLECEPASVQEFSAVAYYFGRDLEKAAQGAGRADRDQLGRDAGEAYTSLEALDAEPSLKHYADRARAAAKQFEMDKKPVAPNTPTVLYNAMIHPLHQVPGEGRDLVPGRVERRPGVRVPHALPDDDQGLAGAVEERLAVPRRATRPVQATARRGRCDYAELRDAQLHATKVLPKVGIAVITDVGRRDGHPPAAEGAGRGAAGARRPGAGLRREDRLQRAGLQGREVRRRRPRR